MSAKQIADTFNLHWGQVYVILREYNVELFYKRRSTLINEAEHPAPEVAEEVDGKPVGYEAGANPAPKSAAPKRRTLMQRIKDFFKD